MTIDLIQFLEKGLDWIEFCSKFSIFSCCDQAYNVSLPFNSSYKYKVNYVFIIFLQIIICKNDRYADIAFSSTS